MPIMKKAKLFSAKQNACPLSIEQLEAGLRVMSNQTTDPDVFWDENVEAFRRTALHAIRDTADALLSPKIPLHWRVELESQLEDLVRYLELADRYIANRTNCGRPVPELPASLSRIH